LIGILASFIPAVMNKKLEIDKEKIQIRNRKDLLLRRNKLNNLQKFESIVEDSFSAYIKMFTSFFSGIPLIELKTIENLRDFPKHMLQISETLQSAQLFIHSKESIEICENIIRLNTRLVEQYCEDLKKLHGVYSDIIAEMEASQTLNNQYISYSRDVFLNNWNTYTSICHDLSSNFYELHDLIMKDKEAILME
jgi:hypothetical protein